MKRILVLLTILFLLNAIKNDPASLHTGQITQSEEKVYVYRVNYRGDNDIIQDDDLPPTDFQPGSNTSTTTTTNQNGQTVTTTTTTGTTTTTTGTTSGGGQLNVVSEISEWDEDDEGTQVNTTQNLNITMYSLIKQLSKIKNSMQTKPRANKNQKPIKINSMEFQNSQSKDGLNQHLKQTDLTGRQVIISIKMKNLKIMLNPVIETQLSSQLIIDYTSLLMT
ncbi:hypothetical protein IMG5_203330 [Ichthyophthirius multifiliis]|uniref:Uncharacterized protein n=1 Tax=Ichthyophthirius multifiliis TaxID=5932 RepID=G0R6A9_ICHMU|nr:hypothetical protein IMG5_203330 [Ichthyophthirius multifiliis]EGR26993.1 hypothetical protein IMG5_203330 [Ichthyophthirius multifiliis]|eukprot:XP_004023877.1 hypothetical protein IMG5_203330 [Ichthyophthirius multifiliis]